jgi:hypothetical protein
MSKCGLFAVLNNIESGKLDYYKLLEATDAEESR